MATAAAPPAAAHGDDGIGGSKSTGRIGNRQVKSLSRKGKNKMKQKDGSGSVASGSDMESVSSATSNTRRSLSKLIVAGWHLNSKKKNRRDGDSSSIDGGSSTSGSIMSGASSRRSFSQRLSPSGGVKQVKDLTTKQDRSQKAARAKMWTSGPQSVDPIAGALFHHHEGDPFEEQLEKLIQPLSTAAHKESEDGSPSSSKSTSRTPSSPPPPPAVPESDGSPISKMDMAGFSLPPSTRKSLMKRMRSKKRNSSSSSSNGHKVRMGDASSYSVKSTRSAMTASSRKSWFGRSKKKSGDGSVKTQIEDFATGGDGKKKQRRSLAKRLAAGFRTKKEQERKQEEGHRLELERIWTSGGTPDVLQKEDEKAQHTVKSAQHQLHEAKTTGSVMVESVTPDVDSPVRSIENETTTQQEQASSVPNAPVESQAPLTEQPVSTSQETVDKSPPSPMEIVPAEQPVSPLIVEEDEAAPVEIVDEHIAVVTPLTAESRVSKTATTGALSNVNDSSTLLEVRTALAETFEEIKKNEAVPTGNLVPCEVTVEPSAKEQNAPQVTAKSPKTVKPSLPTASTPKDILVSTERRTGKKKKDIFKGMKKKKEKNSSVPSQDDGQDGTLGNAKSIDTVKTKKKKKRSRRKKRLRALAAVLVFAFVVGLVLRHCGFFERQRLDVSPPPPPLLQESDNSLMKMMFPKRHEEESQLMYYIDKYRNGPRRKTFFGYW